MDLFNYYTLQDFACGLIPCETDITLIELANDDSEISRKEVTFKDLPGVAPLILKLPIYSISVDESTITNEFKRYVIKVKHYETENS